MTSRQSIKLNLGCELPELYKNPWKGSVKWKAAAVLSTVCYGHLHSVPTAALRGPELRVAEISELRGKSDAAARDDQTVWMLFIPSVVLVILLPIETIVLW